MWRNDVPSIPTIYYLLKDFEEKGSVGVKHKPRPQCARKPAENIIVRLESIWPQIDTFPKKLNLTQQLLWEIMWKDLNLNSFEVKLK